MSQLKLAIVPGQHEFLLNNKTSEYCQIYQTCGGGVILQAILLRSPEVATLILSDLDVPGPGWGGGGGVDVQGDGDTGVTGGHPHVLPGVVAADGGWRGEPRDSN